MAMENYSLSDVAAVTRGADAEGFGGNGAWWIIILFLFLFGANGNGFGGNAGTAAATSQEILYGQQFQAILDRLNSIGNGICDSTFALNNSILNEGRAIQTQLCNCCCEINRNIDAARFDMANYTASINATSTANTQKILDRLCENEKAQMAQRINQLELQTALSGVVRYPQAITYNGGPSPFCGYPPCGYQCNTCGTM